MALQVDHKFQLDASAMIGQAVQTTVDEATMLATLATAAQATPAIATSSPVMSTAATASSRPQTTSQPASSIQVGPGKSVQKSSNKHCRRPICESLLSSHHPPYYDWQLDYGCTMGSVVDSDGQTYLCSDRLFSDCLN